MRIFVWIIIVLIGLNMLLYGDMAINNFDVQKIKYKRALDAATYAAARYREYSDVSYMENIADGHNPDIIIDKEKALKWFYRIFFRNIGLNEDDNMAKGLKKYIIFKGIIGYDTLYIADKNDNWTNIKYEIEHNGKQYIFTLANKIYDKSKDKWIKDIDIGVNEEERLEIVTNFIKENINNFLNLRETANTDGYYYIDFGLVDIDKNTRIDGINFIAFVEGMPIPAFNINQKNKLYAFSFSGAEIRRDS